MISISIRALVLAPIWGVGIVIAGAIGLSTGPDIEEALAPVLSDQSYSAPTRMADRACWHWTYTKRRNAYLTGKAFYIERDDGIRFPVAEVRPDLGIPSNDSTTTKAGVTRTIPECVALPYVVRSAPRFTVHGENLYRPWHGLYDLRQPVITVTIDFPATAAGAPHDDAPIVP